MMAEADLGARIGGISQLGSVVRAMTGIAAARTRTARAQIAAIDSYASTLDQVAAQLGGDLGRAALPPAKPMRTRAALIVICAEQGFVGGFSRHVLDKLESPKDDCDIYLIGSRGAALAGARAVMPVWSGAMPSRSASLPKFADQVLLAIYANGAPTTISALHTVWTGSQSDVQRRALFPRAAKPAANSPAQPLMNLPAPELAASLAQDQLHAQLTRALLMAFVAENEARMNAMASASRQIADELSHLEAKARVARQEAITAEIIEIAVGGLARS